MTHDEYEFHMYLKKQRLINEYADIIRQLYNINVPINDIEEAVMKIGGIVKYDSNCNYIEKSKNRFIIHVEENENFQLKKFRVAQQLGKLFLYTNFIEEHKLFDNNDKISFKDSYYQQGSVNWVNEFALAFLMPKNEYIEEVDKNTNDNIVDTKVLAKHFDVSITNASLRGKRLGILKD